MKRSVILFYFLFPFILTVNICSAQDISIEVLSSAGIVRGDNWILLQRAEQLYSSGEMDTETAVALYAGALASIRMHGDNSTSNDRTIQLQLLKRAIDIFVTKVLISDADYWLLGFSNRLAYIDKQAKNLSIAFEANQLYNKLSIDKDYRIPLILKQTVIKDYDALDNDNEQEALVKAQLSPIVIMLGNENSDNNPDFVISNIEKLIELCSDKKNNHQICLACLGSISMAMRQLAVLSLTNVVTSSRLFNAYLQLNEIMLRCRDFKYDCTQFARSYEDISHKLTNSDCAVHIAYDCVGFKIGYYICSGRISPQRILIFDNKDFCSQIKEAVGDSFHRIYVSSSVLSNNSFHHVRDIFFRTVFSLFDINTSYDSAMYQGGGTLYIGEIDYGPYNNRINDLKPLSYCGIEKDALKSLNQEKFHSLSGSVVDKAFFNAIGTTEILHVASHGVLPPSIPSSQETVALSAFGNEIGIALSGYNKNNDNIITPIDFLKFDYSKLSLLFLSCCNTDKQIISVFGFNSLAQSAFLAGAQNIIAYSNTVRDDIASDFAQMFYKRLSKNPIREAFYISKLETIMKYEKELPKDQYGIPYFPVVLYE